MPEGEEGFLSPRGLAPRLENLTSMRNFTIPSKGGDPESLETWRKYSLALNATRRFRYTADLEKRRERAEALEQKRCKLRTVGAAAKAASRINGIIKSMKPSADVQGITSYEVGVKQLAHLVESKDSDMLEDLGGVMGLAQKLETSPKQGLQMDESDLDQRRDVFGTNTYPEKPPKGFWTFVWEAMHDLTLIILAVCAIVSLIIGVITEGWQEGWYDGAGIGFSIVLVVFVTATSDYQQSLQFRDLEAEKKKIFIEVTRKSRRQKVLIFEILVGDIVHLSIGDQVPADGLYISGCGLSIDESSMTGESEPLKINEENPYLLSGTKVQDGSGLMLVTGVGMNTEWGHLMATLSEGGDDETPLQVKLNGVATLIGKIGLMFAVVTFLVLLGRYLYAKESLSEWSGADALTIVNYFSIAVTIIVVAVPEGLPLAVTLTLAFAMKKMMYDKALVRHLSACETMGSATTICSDKTGTLTTNEMTVTRAWVAGKLRDVANIKSDLSEECFQTLLEGAFQNTSGDVQDSNDGSPASLLGTPTETAVLRFGLDVGGKFKECCSKGEMVKMEPFNSIRKTMGVVVKDSETEQLRAHLKGASEIVLKQCDKYVDADGNIVPLDEAKVKEIKGIIHTFADDALRTLCLAYREIDICPGRDDPIPDKGFVLVAIVGIKDPVRDGVKEAVRLCFAAGIKVRMVTGDNLTTAKAIARECGILTDGEAIEGPTFRDMNPQDMKELIPKLQVMARSSPSDKHTLVRELRELGEVVAVTGDGTNDAPALHEADIGLAMGIAGTEVAKESADVVILDDNFATIVVVAKWGRSVYSNIQKFVQFQLTVNLVALVINFSSACITGTAPLTAVQLLWVNLIMDTLGALALATEPPYDELMTRPPVGRHGSFISNVMWRNIFGQAIYQLAVLSVLQYKGKEILHLEGDGSTELLNTMIFNAFVFCQVFNEINAREMEKLNVFEHTFNNPVFIAILSFTVVFQVLLVQFLGKFAGTVPLNKEQWIITVGIGFMSLFIAVIVKFIPTPKAPMFGGASRSDPDFIEVNGYRVLASEPGLDA
ncbi:hypothetical protein M758_3G006500 [Ceratodon purpureus]|uniref:Calcium-transporting ATPase n=1 Tax=Ceratodon purpureus TaxID=3225 RepID=A0A8T0IFW0_CERPU|nr:hypothetical protein KC19_3G008700 [Ceratodon purpureus]KAG0621270.1 hypothetical protein M758_3G006500 [Ceratodon purpureus]